MNSVTLGLEAYQKHLIVDYRLNGRAFRLLQEEKYPVAFRIRFPSPAAKAPGADSKARAMLETGHLLN